MVWCGVVWCGVSASLTGLRWMHRDLAKPGHERGLCPDGPDSRSIRTVGTRALSSSGMTANANPRRLFSSGIRAASTGALSDRGMTANANPRARPPSSMTDRATDFRPPALLGRFSSEDNGVAAESRAAERVGTRSRALGSRRCAVQVTPAGAEGQQKRGPGKAERATLQARTPSRWQGLAERNDGRCQQQWVSRDLTNEGRACRELLDKA